MSDDRLIEIGVKYVQNNNLHNLQKELGFGEQFPSRDTKSFRQSMENFFRAFEAKNGGLRYLYPKSPEARLCAKEFCEENNRGQKLWPLDNHLYPMTIPQWPRDEEQIIKALAHYFTLQAYHVYQKKHRNKQKKITADNTSPTDIPAQRRSDLALQPANLNIPTNNQNFSRGPAPIINPTTPLNPEISQTNNTAKLAFEKKCLTEIRSLNLHGSSNPVFGVLDREWLSTSKADWPADSFIDKKLKRLMLAKDYYDSDNESDMLDLGKILRKRTEIVEISAPELVRVFNYRLIQRVRFHVSRFRRLGFLKQDKSLNLRKDEVFNEIWKKRGHIWKPTGGAADSSAPLSSLESVQSASTPTKVEPETISISTQAPPAATVYGALTMTTLHTRNIASLEGSTVAYPKGSSTSNASDNAPDVLNLSRRNILDPDFGSSEEKKHKPNMTARAVSNVSFENLTQRSSPGLFVTSQSSQLSVAPSVLKSRFQFQEDEIEQGAEADVEMATDEPAPVPEVPAQARLASPLSSWPIHQFPARERQSLPPIESVVEPAHAEPQLDTPIATGNVTVVETRKRKSPEVHTPRERSISPEDQDWPIEQLGGGDRASSPEALVGPSSAGLTSKVASNSLPRRSMPPAEAAALRRPEADKEKQMTEAPPSNVVSPSTFQHLKSHKQAGETPRSKTPSRSTSSSRRLLESPAFLPKQRLVFIMHKANGELVFNDEDDKGISHWQFQTLSVKDFFFLFAEKSGVSPEDMDSLRFNFMFARENDTSVKKGDEEEWRKLKVKTEVLFQLRSEKELEKVDWPVVVEAEKSGEGVHREWA